MINEPTLRQLALALPQVDEHTHWERPAFRVNKKIFATIWPLQQRVIVKVSLGEQARLIRLDSITYSAVEGHWEQRGYTIAQYDNLSSEECACLLRQSWQLIAPKYLAYPKAEKGAFMNLVTKSDICEDSCSFILRISYLEVLTLRFYA